MRIEIEIPDEELDSYVEAMINVRIMVEDAETSLSPADIVSGLRNSSDLLNDLQLQLVEAVRKSLQRLALQGKVVRFNPVHDLWRSIPFKVWKWPENG